MISGVYQPDEGEIYLSGEKINIQSPIEALANGIETLYQDLALAENLNVYSNIFLGREKTKKVLGFIDVLDHDYMFNESQKVLERLDIKIPSLSATIRTLSGGQRQAVAISRSIYWDAKVLIMDEPTAALGIAEQRKVLSLVKSLKNQGIGIIIISHQMHDVFEVADRIVVMRRGIKAGERLVKDVNPDDVVSLIVGAEEVKK
jgi:simple sugar transport system ATP-binding protein